LPAFVCFTRRSDGTHCGTACVALTCHPALPPDVNRSVDSLTLCLPACLPACLQGNYSELMVILSGVFSQLRGDQLAEAQGGSAQVGALPPWRPPHQLP
jgi:hypothetical protein